MWGHILTPCVKLILPSEDAKKMNGQIMHNNLIGFTRWSQKDLLPFVVKTTHYNSPANLGSSDCKNKGSLLFFPESCVKDKYKNK